MLTTPFRELAPLHEAIGSALLDAGYEPLPTDANGATAPPGFELVRAAIERADLVVADLTGDNPNVMYELGFAHGLRKPVVLLVQAGSKRVPPPVAGYRYFVYDPSDPSTVVQVIRDAARDLLASKVPA